MSIYSAVPGWAIVAAGVLYLALQIAAFKQFSEKPEKALKTLVVPLVAAFYVIDRLLGATGWAALEGWALLPLVFAAVIYLTANLICELRKQRQSTMK